MARKPALGQVAVMDMRSPIAALPLGAFVRAAPPAWDQYPMHDVYPCSYKRRSDGGFAAALFGMDTTIIDHNAPEPWRSVFLVFLWFILATVLAVDLRFADITLLPFYAMPALIAAVFLPPRYVTALVAGGLTCGITVGLYFGLMVTPQYLLRMIAVSGIGVMSVVLAAARERQSAAAEQERARIRATLDSLLDPHILLRAIRDASGKITDFVYADANEAACRYNRLPRAQLLGRSLLELFPAHITTGLLDLYRRAIESGRPLALDDYPYPHDIFGEQRYYDIRAVKVGEELSYTWRDVTERHYATQKLEQHARTDELTRLLNRREVFERLEDLRGKTPRTGRDIAVLFIDFDRFKNVNDTYGHAAGDEVLRVTADRVRACLRHSDDLGARLGGDEMMIVLHGLHGIGDAVTVAEKLRRSAAAPVRFDGQSIEATVSVGVTLARAGEDTATLVARADDAMYCAKQRGRNQVITINGPTPP